MNGTDEVYCQHCRSHENKPSRCKLYDNVYVPRKNRVGRPDDKPAEYCLYYKRKKGV